MKWLVIALGLLASLPVWASEFQSEYDKAQLRVLIRDVEQVARIVGYGGEQKEIYSACFFKVALVMEKTQPESTFADVVKFIEVSGGINSNLCQIGKDTNLTWWRGMKNMLAAK